MSAFQARIKLVDKSLIYPKSMVKDFIVQLYNLIIIVDFIVQKMCKKP